MEEKYTLELTLSEKISMENAVANQMIKLHEECKGLKKAFGLEKVQSDRLNALKDTYNAINKDKQNQALRNADDFLASVDRVIADGKARIKECGF